MFDNVGEKLMGLAQITFWLIIVATGLWVIVVWIEGNFGLGLLVGLGGFLVSLSTWFLYAFGQLVQDVSKLTQGSSQLNNPSNGTQAVFKDLPNL